jgi:hypothetical protein
VCQLLIFKYVYIFDHSIAVFTVILMFSLAFAIFVPCHICFVSARKAFLIALYNIVISPFGLVKFRHFFIADILTSMVGPLKDLVVTLYFLF